MADLDNFFAKKDRKKSNKGKKFSTSSDNVTTSQEELQKKQDKQKKERALIQSNYSNENNENKSSTKLEEEWNEYQEEIKDYTTLKIQNLTTDSPYYSDNNDKEDDVEFEENEAGEMVPKRKNPGPWKVHEPEPTPPTNAPEPVVEEKKEVKKNAYVPPAHRNNFQGGPRSAPRSKTSLDVKDEDMFPTLQGNNTVKRSVAPAAKKVETPVWSKYQ
ncbi:protein CDV3 homolog isoform X1 [Sipha flava]|uniref:Protein CDV3 homolog isoform X1 n=1 Tax=Sipha flava TaxID=143950 RepID=A0A8B8GMF6_9HEMI|nr:protein CDV3 homolog isoform X1 [Sipha flava]XP_025423576.1 protein CDV3 homolog isoform X1 [Sipha flava]XP_025423577.1 protein CDV3 homolog isoform X1 [Sipha flava]